MRLRAISLIILAAGSAFCAGVVESRPAAMVDLATAEGARLVRGEWRYSDTRIVETRFRTAGADGQPGFAPNTTYDIEPHAGGRGFDDSKWQVIAPETLDRRRSTGRLCFSWYRINVTIPEQVDGMAIRGTTAVFETSVDDYAEVWVDGELVRAPGQSGGSVVAGWNAENRVVVGRNLKPGRKIQLAVFGANGPLSNPPTNYIWLRYARLEFYRGQTGPVAIPPAEVNVEVIRKDPRIDEIVPLNAKVFKLAEGFQFTEGPAWSRAGGYLLFSDPNANTIYKYSPAPAELSVFRTPSGYAGEDIAEYTQPGSNGLTFDAQGRLTINEHGNRRVTRLEPGGEMTVLADRFDGKRLNSPNDLVYRSDGTVYFTDPPFGLPKFFGDLRREIPFSGVYAAREGKVRLVAKDLTGPNGIAFSPDQKFLYVTNWDERAKVIMRYAVESDGSLSNGRVFFDMTSAPGEDALDGMKVDRKGNLYVSGPGGLWIVAPDGTHLGTVVTAMHPHNLAWGDEDGHSLYLCAETGLYRMRVYGEGR